MSSWNPLTDGFPEFWRDYQYDGVKGKIDLGIHRAENCVLRDYDHDFGMLDQVAVERDSNLAFHLNCGCSIVLSNPLGGVIEAKE